MADHLDPQPPRRWHYQFFSRQQRTESGSTLSGDCADVCRFLVSGKRLYSSTEIATR
jgi:hypothetical protein